MTARNSVVPECRREQAFLRTESPLESFELVSEGEEDTGLVAATEARVAPS